MHGDMDADATLYKVVVSQENQYSIWPAYKPNAPGWSEAGKQGSRLECLAHIQQIWTDMRPKSLREMME